MPLELFYLKRVLVFASVRWTRSAVRGPCTNGLLCCAPKEKVGALGLGLLECAAPSLRLGMCWPAVRLVCLRVLVVELPGDTQAHHDRITDNYKRKKKGFSFLFKIVQFCSAFPKL